MKLDQHGFLDERWSALIIGDSAGLLAEPGHDWSSHPSYYERADVVRADLVDAELARLRAALAERDAEIERWSDRALNAENDLEIKRRRSRLPEELVDRIRDGVGWLEHSMVDDLLNDILAALEPRK